MKASSSFIRCSMIGVLVPTNIIFWMYMTTPRSANLYCFDAATIADAPREINPAVNMTSQHLESENKDSNILRKLPRDQTTMVYNTDDIFTIPQDDELKKLSKDDLMYIFDRYINSFHYLCHNQRRIGNLGDGGKDVCVDKAIKPSQNCIVYSFGSANDFTFEDGVLKHFGCKVYTFDPSLQEVNITKPDGCEFFSVGLGDKDFVNENNWKIQTFDTTRKLLGHFDSTIDILKIDIEGMEWDTFDQMLQSGSFDKVKQLQVELHFYDNAFHTEVDTRGLSRADIERIYLQRLIAHQKVVRENKLGVLRRMHEYGLRLFSRERNVNYDQSVEYLPEYKVYVAPLVEISLINTRLV